MSITVRPATERDVEQMAAVKTIGWATTYADLVPAEVLDRFTDVEAQCAEIRSILNDPAGTVSVLVADIDADVVGYITGDTTNGFVDVLHVLPQWRSAGVGRQLLFAMAQSLAEVGCGRLWLHVVLGNVRAEKFYARLGGVPTDVEAADWAPGHDVLQTTFEWNDIHDLITLGPA